MHITSFEISKKLAEIGFFRKNHQFYWVEYKNEITPQKPKLEYWEKVFCNLRREQFPAHDLETIFDALPMGIDKDDKRYDLIINQRVFFSYNDDEGNELEEFSIMQEGEESLADTAARLLIKLHEAGIVEFKEE